jgi:hypothetical protein
LLTALLGLVPAAAADPTVWTGPDISFSKVANADPTVAANQDHITDSVWITRGTIQGIFNAATGSADCASGSCTYTHLQSPAGTQWATALTSPGQDITATNWAALTFESWEQAYGAREGLQFNIVGADAVVRLVNNPSDNNDDIYLNLKFSDWAGGGSGGAFTYTRSTPASVITTTGDYNGNHIVDAADYTVWRDTLGKTASPPGSGADGNANGTIDNGDYDFWKMKFGTVVPGAGAGAQAASAVPEPATWILLTAYAVSMLWCRELRRRGRPVR